MRRRAALALCFVLAGATLVAAGERRYTIGFANLTDAPGETIEDTGFTGEAVQQSFVLAARLLPVDLVFYDNRHDPRRATANARAAAAAHVELFIEYDDDPGANAAVAAIMKGAGIPVLAVNYPVPGAPLYTADNEAAGRIAGDALGRFGRQHWPGTPMTGLLLGDWRRPSERLTARAQGIRRGLRAHLHGIEVVEVRPEDVGRFVATHPRRKFLVAAMSDELAVGAKAALEKAGRASDAVIVGQGLDPRIHGTETERREIDPNNRGSVILGSVAFYLDRYGYDILPLALRMLRGARVPDRTVTRHLLVTGENVWREYPGPVME